MRIDSRLDAEVLSWWLFLACAVFFLIGSIAIGDVLFIIGSALFLAACLVFLVGRDRSPDR